METLPLEKVIEIGVQVGLRTAVETMRKEKEERRKSRYDRRLRNTRLLLRNYRELVAHCSEAVFRIKKCGGNAIDILDQIDDEELDDDLYIESIKCSTERIALIIAHIDNMISIYRYMCEKSDKPEDFRKYRVIMGLYIDEDGRTIQELANDLICDPRTISRDRDGAVVTLSALIFGIDGLKMDA